MLLILYYLLVGLHLIQLGSIYYSIRRYKKYVNNNFQPISILIAARNEYTNLRELIPLLLDQNYPEFEIIVALDRCNDESKKLLINLADKYSNIKMVIIDTLPPGFAGKKYALNQAIKLAQNEWLLFTDADCKPVSNYWIKSFAENIRPDTSILLGISPYQANHTLLNQFIQYETLLTAMKYVSSALNHRPYMGVGRNLAYRKSLFFSSDGYYPQEHISGGDDDLFIQKNASTTNTFVVMGKESLVFSIPKDTLRSYLTQKTRHLNIGKYYEKKLSHVYSTILHAMLWLCFLYLVFIYPVNSWVILTFIFLMIIKGLIFKKTSRKMGFNYNPLFLPISDLIYGILYPFIGLRALLFRKVKWK